MFIFMWATRCCKQNEKLVHTRVNIGQVVGKGGVERAAYTALSTRAEECAPATF
jgi:hypothetical protein